MNCFMAPDHFVFTLYVHKMYLDEFRSKWLLYELLRISFVNIQLSEKQEARFHIILLALNNYYCLNELELQAVEIAHYTVFSTTS